MNSFGDPYGQLQFEFDGIPALTKAEQLARAIDRGEMDLAGRCGLEAALWLEDEETRLPRLQRWLHIREIEVRHSRAGAGWLIPGHAEGLWLYTEAASAYVNGEYLAVIVCSHAAAERTLAARLQLRDQLDGLDRAGLGPLVRKAHTLHLIDDEAQTDLLKLNAVRRPIAHHKPGLEPNSISERLRARALGFDFAHEVDDLLRADAEHALDCADFVLRGMGPGL